MRKRTNQYIFYIIIIIFYTQLQILYADIVRDGHERDMFWKRVFQLFRISTNWISSKILKDFHLITVLNLRYS